jgi:hypothetical protein
MPFSQFILMERDFSLLMAETRSTASNNGLRSASSTLSLPVGMTRP